MCDQNNARSGVHEAVSGWISADWPSGGPLWVLLLVLGLACAPAPAADGLEQELRRIEAELSLISREQQSVYQQFQMVQVMLRSEESQLQPLQQYTPPPAPRNYDDVKREENDRTARIQQLKQELERLYSRHRELEEQKGKLLQSLSSLQQRSNSPATAPQ
jgi:chromosome segregation ATPase